RDSEFSLCALGELCGFFPLMTLGLPETRGAQRLEAMEREMASLVQNRQGLSASPEPKVFTTSATEEFWVRGRGRNS
ncbi:MAG: hypothetical protein AAF394_14165, partial [Planctomycetota bacterium]